MSDVDIVIVNYRSAAHTAACVESVHRVALSDGVSVNVTIVNNGDGTANLESVVAARGPAAFLHNAANLGFGAACNMGADRGGARLILFLNPDARLTSGALATLVAFMDEPNNAGVGILGPSIEGEDGALTRTSSALPSLSGLLMQTIGLGRAFLAAHDHERSGHVGQVMGAVLMIRRSLFSELGGFDRRFFLYYEDVDLCARAAAKGYLTHYLVTARAIHAGRASSSQDTGLALALFLQSRFTYARIHFSPVAEAVLVAASIVAELPLRLFRTLFGGKSISGGAVLRAYRLLFISAISGGTVADVGIGVRGR